MKLFDLTGRVAIVTGGNGGIGLGMARGLAQCGASVMVAARDEAKNAAAVEELRALGTKAAALEADLTREEACKSTVQATLSQFGRLDVLVNNAGKNIMIGSMMSIFGASFTAPYAATKGGIVQMAKAMACAWGKDNIQVNSVLPGWIDTALTRQARRDIAGLEERVVARTPAGRWGVPGDFSGIAAFLASSASDFVTGAAITVDGGYSVQG